MQNPTSTDPAKNPDLLHAEPIERVDLEQTRLAITLAFAGGVSGGLFADTLEASKLAPSDWDPACFSNDLFLRELVAQRFKIRVGGHEPEVSTRFLVRLIAHPPSDRAIVAHRREVLRELSAKPELRTELERLYGMLCAFRTLMEGAVGIGRGDANRRQLDILQKFREIVDCAATGFGSSTSGLSRLAAFGLRIREGEPFRSLCDLLRYDENSATLDLKVGVGADGQIRGFEIKTIEQDAQNPFVTSVLRRWLAKIELFVRGFHFGDGEIMARMVDAVFEGVKDDTVRLVQLIGDIELYLGALCFRDQAESAGLAVCLPELVTPESPRKLHGLFNPLLLSLGTKVIPCDIELDRHDTTALVTGPNSGGKTRLLQSLALAQLLAQSGLFVPARSGSMALCDGLVVSLIQETFANQPEGRLGMELMRIRQLFEKLPPGTMVILDELCSGTNPSEGEEIFELVVRMLGKLRPQAFITTHFLSFAGNLERAKKIEGLRFLQVQLGENNEPTYQFGPGVALTSLAGQTAARLGVTADQLLQLVEQNVARTRNRPS